MSAECESAAAAQSYRKTLYLSESLRQAGASSWSFLSGKTIPNTVMLVKAKTPCSFALAAACLVTLGCWSSVQVLPA
jgi:hypothetical protein